MELTSTNPATGERVASFAAHDAAEVERRLASAARASARWRAVPLETRTAVVLGVADLLDREVDRIAAIITTEMGKPIGAARDEVRKCATCCRHYAEHAGAMIADEPIAIEGERAFVTYQPIGIVLAVMPWNFPLWQVIRFAAPAICAGNVGLLKHASNVPQCALELESLFLRAGAPEGVFQALLVGSDAVAGILADPRVAAATLTGSEGAGSKVGETAGRHLKKTVLELGGSDPFVVMPSADLDEAVRVGVRARIVNSGQSCIAAKRFIVHTTVYDAFTTAFVEAMAALRVGDPMDERTEVGPLATPAIRDELDEQVQRTVAAGARVLTGGRRREGPGAFYEPTVLADIPDGSPAQAEELFGPVASIFRVADADEAIRIANDTPYGLGASVWTRDAGEAERFARAIDAGSVFINGQVASDPRAPFGGIKRSGYGRELSAIGLREFMNVKTVRMRDVGG